MSELRNMQLDNVADRESAFADQVKSLATGATFMAEISGIEDMSLNDALGIDPRATDTFCVRDKSIQFSAGDIWQVFGRKFQVLPKNAPDNPVAVQLKIYCQAGVPGKDTWA